MMHKKIFALGMVIPLVMCGCGKSGADVIINVEGYEGIVLMTDVTAAAPVSIPDGPVFTVPPDASQTGETTAEDASGVSEDTEPVVSAYPTAAVTEQSWTETPISSTTMYVNTDGIYSRAAAIVGSARVDRYSINEAVTVLAKTNTNYYKISGGAFIHSDYLSVSTIPAETEGTTPQPEETDPPETGPEETEPSETDPEETDPPEENLTPIMGSSVATAEQMRRYIRKMNPDVADSVIEMIPYYLSEGEKEGVRGDIAFAQSCVETGYFRFEKTGTGSAVTIDQNNFCGMGVTSLGIKGESFPTPQIGIRAQIQHLKAYGSTLPLNGEKVDNRFNYVVRGCAEYWEWLGMQENPSGRGWAGGKGYGPLIIKIYNDILSS